MALGGSRKSMQTTGAEMPISIYEREQPRSQKIFLLPLKLFGPDSRNISIPDKQAGDSTTPHCGARRHPPMLRPAISLQSNYCCFGRRSTGFLRHTLTGNGGTAAVVCLGYKTFMRPKGQCKPGVPMLMAEDITKAFSSMRAQPVD
jgi:hypothetical protein